jgi:hypothetical protein
MLLIDNDRSNVELQVWSEILPGRNHVEEMPGFSLDDGQSGGSNAVIFDKPGVIPRAFR